VGSTRGKWDILRDCLVVKGIPFLVLCKVEGEREVGEWDCCRNNGLKGNSLVVIVSCWVEGGKP
jgi:hypothetical protein